VPDELDGDLLERFVEGDEHAFEALFRQFEVEVYRWILRIVRDSGAAEDVLVEAFWRAYRGRARFDPSRSFGAWMRRIATNAALDHLRATRRRTDGTAWSAADNRLAAPARPDPGVAESIALAFRRLPPKLLVVATLALIEEQPYAEIADALDLPVGTVKSRVFRATEALRKELARLGIRP
jgi:RNA polymerase sigma-70 factor (ECF subfamily)